MRYKNWYQRILAILCGGALLLCGGSVLAAVPHEDPETATTVFSGIALFRYYSYSLDSILLKNSAEAQAKLGKLPWANVPESLETVTEDFGASGINLAQLVVQIDRRLSQLRVFREQSRLDEAAELAIGISANLTEARGELGEVERAVTATGLEFKVSSGPEGSDLKISYNEVWDRINRIREMLKLSVEVLINELQGMPLPEAVVKTLQQHGINVDSPGIPPGKMPDRTEITLSLEPTMAFVGDNVRFWGTLASGQNPLAERDVEILLNNSVYQAVQKVSGNHNTESK